MNRRHGGALACLFGWLCWLPVLLGAQSSPSLLRFVDEVYLQQKSDAEMQAAYDALLPTLSDPYEQALLHYQMGRVYQLFDDTETTLQHNRKMQQGAFIGLFRFYRQREAAVACFERCEEQSRVRAAESLPPVERARWIALQAGAVSQLALVKSPGYTLLNGPKVEKLAKQALTLDPNNADALLLLANAKVYPPTVYFGNPSKGVELLTALDRCPSLSKENNFNRLLGFAYSYGRMGNQRQADSFIRQALAVYPSNQFALAVQQLIRQGALQ